MLRIDLREQPDADLTPAVEHLRAGGLIAYPTETVYGFGSLTSPEGVRALRELKSREAHKPFIVLIPSAQAASALTWNQDARDLADVFWPGAVTLVLNDPTHSLPAAVRSEGGNVAVRVSPQPVVARLLEAVGEPLTSTSANGPGGLPARSGSEVSDMLDRLGRDDVMVLDAGTLSESASSTIIDCTGDVPVVLRQGSVPVGRLRCAIPEIHE